MSLWTLLGTLQEVTKTRIELAHVSSCVGKQDDKCKFDRIMEPRAYQPFPTHPDIAHRQLMCPSPRASCPKTTSELLHVVVGTLEILHKNTKVSTHSKNVSCFPRVLDKNLSNTCAMGLWDLRARSMHSNGGAFDRMCSFVRVRTYPESLLCVNRSRPLQPKTVFHHALCAEQS